MSGPTGFADRCLREIDDLHDFFGRWYRGESPQTGDALSRLERALAPEFVMVTPDGTRHDRAAVVAGVRAGYGDNAGVGSERAVGEDSSATETRAFEIAIVSPSVVDRTEDRCLVTYEEHHRGPVETARSSAAWFVPDPDAPTGVQWLFLQETWLPDAAPPEEG